MLSLYLTAEKVFDDSGYLLVVSRICVDPSVQMRIFTALISRAHAKFSMTETEMSSEK